MSCNPQKIVAALHEQALEITDIVREEIKDSDNFALRMIPDGGTVKRHSTQDTVIYGEAKQAPVGYRQLDHSARALESGGEFPARNLQGANGIFEADKNEIDDNACHGMVTIDFSQGYRIRRTSDYGLDLDTPIKCSRELDRLGEAHIRGYFNGFKNQFTSFGMSNFSDNLLNLTIQFGEANTSVRGAEEFHVSTGGWEAEPLYRVSIHFLQDYRDYIAAEMKGRGLRVSEDWMLEVEMPRNDWFDAVIADQINRRGVGSVSGIQTSLNTEFLKDEEGPLRGRQFHVYGGIKCYFNETPIRGYFVPTSLTSKRFVRVYDWINTQDEEGGIVRRANHQYRQDTISVDNVRYNMVTLIPHIDPRSFKRYGLIKPLKPFGNDNAGVNYEVRVIDGARLGCNDFDDKFKFAARHEFRFKAEYPEFSGYIAYRSSRREGYVIAVNSRTDDPEYTATKTVNPEAFRVETPDDCQVAECAQCGQVPDAEGQCVATDTEVVELRLVPAAAVSALSTGVEQILGFSVERYANSNGVIGTGACSVVWTAAEVSGTGALSGTVTGTLEWAAGDMAAKAINVTVDNTAVADYVFTVTLTAAVGATVDADKDQATVTFV